MEQFQSFTRDSKVGPWGRIAKKYLTEQHALDALQAGWICAIQDPLHPEDKSRMAFAETSFIMSKGKSLKKYIEWAW